MIEQLKLNWMVWLLISISSFFMFCFLCFFFALASTKTNTTKWTSNWNEWTSRKPFALCRVVFVDDSKPGGLGSFPWVGKKIQSRVHVFTHECQDTYFLLSNSYTFTSYLCWHCWLSVLGRFAISIKVIRLAKTVNEWLCFYFYFYVLFVSTNRIQ